jgi:pimeloyl-ACP methyl ester carboxylesterase
VTESPRRTRDVAGRPAAWLEAGSGPPLALIHGAGGAAELWRPQLEGLADVARIVAPDLPGHGPLGGRGKPSITDYADWLEGLFAALEAGPLVLVGHSMGGAVAQSLALARPGRLAGLVLVSTGARLRVLARLVDLLRVRPREGQRLIRELSFATAPRW